MMHFVGESIRNRGIISYLFPKDLALLRFSYLILFNTTAFALETKLDAILLWARGC